MRIYLASGYSVMNAKGRERRLRRLFGSSYKRLVSFFDAQRGNNIYATMGIKRPKEEEK